MHNPARGRPTIGVLSTWSIYEGTTIDQYAHTLLQAAGRRIPDDVAVIGFDNILDTRSHLPPLTSVRHLESRDMTITQVALRARQPRPYAR